MLVYKYREIYISMHFSRFKDDYDDKDSGLPLNAGSSEGLVKPAAPPSSVYARPRAPPKFRRPVPLSEQDKYTFSTSTTARPLIGNSNDTIRINVMLHLLLFITQQTFSFYEQDV